MKKLYILECQEYMRFHPTEASDIIDKWCAKHPQKTYSDDFFSKFPNAPKEDDGTPFPCRDYIYGPVSREQVEQVWRSYWYGFSNDYADGYKVYDEWQCHKCGFEVETDEPKTLPQFCPGCGAPMTDEAVQMVLERLEALKDGSTTD